MSLAYDRRASAKSVAFLRHDTIESRYKTAQYSAFVLDTGLVISGFQYR